MEENNRFDMNTTNLRRPSNKVRDIERYCHTELDSIYGKEEVGMFIRMLFEKYLGWNLTDLLIHKDKTVNQSDLLRFHWAVEDLRRQRPIQHIIGHTSFCGCHIDVDESVLIPRPETEELVYRIIQQYDSQIKPRRILDICTGSGCIAIALKKQWTDAEVLAVDISPYALDKARHNAEINHADICFIEADVLNIDAEKNFGNIPFNLIVSNPPYIREQEKQEMQKNVLEYEPHQALFVSDEQPLVFYQSIVSVASKVLSNSGKLVFEINEALGEEMLVLLRENHFEGLSEINLQKDFRGKDRFIFTTKSSSFNS